MKPERELAEICIDNSYNPPVLNLYCGKCDGFVEEMPPGSEIPYRDEVLCAECQDELEELEKQRNKLMDLIGKQKIKDYVFRDRTLKIMVPGFSQSTLKLEVVDNKILKIRGKSHDFGTVSYNINIPENTESIKVNIFNGILMAEFVEKEDADIPIIYDNEYEEEITKIEDIVRGSIKLS